MEVLRRRATLTIAFGEDDADAQPASTPPAAWTRVNDGLASLLGYVPSTTLEQGLGRMPAA